LAGKATADFPIERWSEPELYRIAGEIALMLPTPNTAKATVYFDLALSVGRQQKAKSWELRSTRLTRGTGRHDGLISVVTPFDGHPFLASPFVAFARGAAKLYDLLSVRFFCQVCSMTAVLARPLGDIVEATDDDAFDAPAFWACEWELHAVEHAEDHGRQRGLTAPGSGYGWLSVIPATT
jgi:hypothetical protein